MIVLDRTGPVPLYEQLYQALRSQVIGGELAAGQKLPSRRTLAQELGISVNTVDGAYSQLASEGYITARARSGYVVCRVDAVQRVELSQPRTAPVEDEKPRYAVDFSPGGIAAEQFPLTVWQRLTREVLASRQWLFRGSSQGDAGLRQAIADYLQKARNVRCTADSVIIGSGTEGLMAMLGMLLDRDITFAVENPVYNQAHRMLARMGHPVVPAEVDRQGVMVEPLEALDNVVVYTTPSHQYPLGICMPMSRRAKLLNWCAGGRFRYLLEDDYDSEFRYDARPIPPLHSIDRNQRVIYLGTFSGTVAPSLRIGYMVLPPELLRRYRAGNLPFACQVPTADQLVLREYMVQGYFEKHLNRMRTYYKKQRQLLLTVLAQKLPRVQIIGEAAGHHVTLRVPGRRSQQWLCDRAAEQGVKVYPISRYFIGNMPEIYAGKLLLGFGGLSREEITDGIERLKRAWQDA